MRPAIRLPMLRRGARVLVVGLGLHGGGVAVVRALAARGFRVRVTDAKIEQELLPSLRALRRVRFEGQFGKHRESDVRWAEVVVQNPAVPRSHPLIRLARKLHRPVVNDAVLFLAWAPGPVVAVTGTRGKSTTVALAAAMLGSQRGGLPGEPLLDLLASVPNGATSVVEFSSWQCELLRDHQAAPDVAVITNVSPDHLNRYASFSAYMAAKANLLRWQSPRASFAVLSREQNTTRSFGALVRGHRAWFSQKPFAEEDGAFLQNGWFMVRDAGQLIRVAPRALLSVPGDHLAENALAAIAAVWWMHPNRSRIRRALKQFRGLPGRQELVRRHRGVLYINDTTATSPAGTQAALDVYAKLKPVLIAGGVDKKLTFGPLARSIVKSCSAVVLLPGSASDILERKLVGRVTVLHADSMHEAVRVASLLARPRSAVLLSPSAASFNLFRHEYERGTEFVKAVQKLS